MKIPMPGLLTKGSHIVMVRAKAFWPTTPVGQWGSLWLPSPLASSRAWFKLKVLSKGIIQKDNGPEMLAGRAQSLGVM